MPEGDERLRAARQKVLVMQFIDRKARGGARRPKVTEPLKYKNSAERREGEKGRRSGSKNE